MLAEPGTCPSAEQFVVADGQEWNADAPSFFSIDAALLDEYVSDPLLEGGCAYAASDVLTANNSASTYRNVTVLYLHLGEDGWRSSDELGDWAESAGGTSVGRTFADGSQEPDGSLFELPTEFSGWSGALLDMSNTLIDDVTPEFTQGEEGRLNFNLDEADVDALVSAGTAADGPTVILSDSWTDDNGYSYSVSLYAPAINVDMDTVDALPGKANLSYSIEFLGQIANTTAARNAPTPSLAVMPIWSSDSPVCSTEAATAAFGSNDVGMEERWCTVLGDGIDLFPSNPDGTETTSITAGDRPALSASGSRAVNDVEEASAESVATALKSPAAYVIGRTAGENLTECLVRNNFLMSTSTAETGCRLED